MSWRLVEARAAVVIIWAVEAMSPAVVPVFEFFHIVDAIIVVVSSAATTATTSSTTTIVTSSAASAVALLVLLLRLILLLVHGLVGLGDCIDLLAHESELLLDGGND